MKNYRYLDIVMVAFVAVLLVSNVASNKLVTFGPFTYDAGTLLFPLSYIFGDVLTEVYGYKRSRRVIWLGFGSAALMAAVLWVVTLLPIPADQGPQPQSEAFNVGLASTSYIIIGSLVAFFAGEFSNSFVLAKLKVATKGRLLWLRTIGSTVVGQAVDTLLFVTIAFGVGFALMGFPMEGSLFWTIVISNYIFKVGVEVLFTPLTYAIVGFLKRAEREDYYDTHTNFNPFALSAAD
ncbi:MAG: queuosine precursor transporter [Chloroflexota bacterium]|nr:queuosine precursor transporter [Chloroflexota bacterium]MDQ5866946.1 queuosine precursor transporter [Chloroflexota bacterium]